MVAQICLLYVGNISCAFVKGTIIWPSLLKGKGFFNLIYKLLIIKKKADSCASVNVVRLGLYKFSSGRGNSRKTTGAASCGCAWSDTESMSCCSCSAVFRSCFSGIASEGALHMTAQIILDLTEAYSVPKVTQN